MFAVLQRQLWDEGGYIIWGDQDLVDATSRRVRGLTQKRYLPLGGYDFKTVSVT
jgi:peptide/nickel transport system substrate-binding protein